jgi:hypothetical protein
MQSVLRTHCTQLPLPVHLARKTSRFVAAEAWVRAIAVLAQVAPQRDRRATLARMVTFSEDERFASLIAALKLVAAEPEEQLAALPELQAIAAQIREGEPAVELIDETLVREGVLPADVGEHIRRIDELFDQLVARVGALSSAALSEAPEWGLMRVAARHVLDELGIVFPGSVG